VPRIPALLTGVNYAGTELPFLYPRAFSGTTTLATSTRLRLPRSPFIRSVVKSGLLAPDDIVGILSHYDAEKIEKADPLQLATFFVRKKLLTKFQAMQLLNGRTQGFLLDHYRIKDGLRQDRVGMVFVAENMETKEIVSVKVLPTDRVADETMYRPFLKEARRAAKVESPTVARVLDMGIWNDTHYVVSEYVAAPTLDKLIAQKGPLSPNLAAQVVAQTAVGLMHAHAAELIHRDIKPANIAILPNRRVKLLDLGLTHMLDNPWAQVTKRIKLKEYAEEIAHIPPEQAWGCELDARSDIYSLGSTAYYLLTGQHPFPGLASEMMTERQLRGVPKPSSVRPGIPPELDELVQKMGAKEQHLRFQSAKDLVEALHPWLPVADWAELGIEIKPRQPERKAKAKAKGKTKAKPATKKVEKPSEGFLATVGGFFGRVFRGKR
jgi:serine/threonine-protein kinase